MFTGAQYSQLTIVRLSNTGDQTPGPAVCGWSAADTGGGDCYWVYLNAAGVFGVYRGGTDKTASGSGTGGTFSAGNVVKLTFSSPTLKLWNNGTEIWTWDDPSPYDPASRKWVGFTISYNSTTAPTYQLDDWEGGTYVPASSTAPLAAHHLAMLHGDS